MIKHYLVWLRKYRNWILFFLGMAMFRTAVADWSYVPSGSMEPTMFPGDVLLVNKIALGPSIPFTQGRLFATGQPERGDIITFYPPSKEKQLVKRVIGVPGDTLAIEGNTIWLNGKPLEVQFELLEGTLIGSETLGGRQHPIQYSQHQSNSQRMRPITIPAGKYFVLGDHRDNSLDSRFWGFVDEESIMGKVTHLALSFSSKRRWHQRIGHSLL